jgi:hypothetical protein
LYSFCVALIDLLSPITGGAKTARAFLSFNVKVRRAIFLISPSISLVHHGIARVILCPP